LIGPLRAARPCLDSNPLLAKSAKLPRADWRRYAELLTPEGADLAVVPIEPRHDFHENWNYTIAHSNVR